MKSKQCAACGQPFQPCPQVPQQSYCSAPDCQRERRRQWQRLKLQTDPDYQGNQSSAQRGWLDRNPDYWRKYRTSHPEYAERNRVLQQGRNAKTRIGSIAKMDVSNPGIPLPAGIYRLRWTGCTGTTQGGNHAIRQRPSIRGGWSIRDLRAISNQAPPLQQGAGAPARSHERRN